MHNVGAEDKFTCLFNREVDCDMNFKQRHCDNCGWRPMVSAERALKIRERMAKEKEAQKNG